MTEPLETTRAAVLVGGRASRMRGVAKGLLVAPSGEAIVARWLALFAQLEIHAALVGRDDSFAPYCGAGLLGGVECVLDEPGVPGPLGGLVAALAWAESRGAARLIVVACDMPHVRAATLERLLRSPGRARALAARRDGRLEPLFARYDVAPALEAARRRAASGSFALRDVLEDLDVEVFDAPPPELDDWDAPHELAPADVARNAAVLP